MPSSKSFVLALNETRIWSSQFDPKDMPGVIATPLSMSNFEQNLSDSMLVFDMLINPKNEPLGDTKLRFFVSFIVALRSCAFVFICVMKFLRYTSGIFFIAHAPFWMNVQTFVLMCWLMSVMIFAIFSGAQQYPRRPPVIL